MESALTISPPVARASACPSADLPLAVGPAISQMRGSMELVVTLVGLDSDTAAVAERVRSALAAAGAAVKSPRPLGPAAFDLIWTFFAYESDDAAMLERRLRHANLMGPAGFVSIDDSEVMDLTQRGLCAAADGAAVVEMGGRGVEDQDHIVTEVAIRAFYDHYRKVMEL